MNTIKKTWKALNTLNQFIFAATPFRKKLNSLFS